MMKIAFYLLAAILTLAACSKEQVATEPVEENPVAAGKTMTLKATLEDTRGEISSDGKFSWSNGDQIAVPFRNADNDLVYILFTSNGSQEFTHVFSEGDNYELEVGRNAYYPFSAVSATDQVSLDGSVIPLVAQVGDNETLAFKHLSAFMDVTFTGLPVAVSQIRVTGVHAGPYTVNYNEGNPSLTPVGGTGTDHYSIPVSGEGSYHAAVSFAPGTYNSLTFSLLTTDGRVVYSKSTSRTLERKNYYRMPSLAYSAPTKFYVTTSSNSHYWDKTDVSLVQTGSSSYELWMNCDGGTTISIYDEYSVGQGGTPLWTGTVNDGNYYMISWNSASATGSVGYVKKTQDYPWGIQSFENLAIYDNFSGSWQERQLNYNGNHFWSTSITVATEGTYSFKMKVYNVGWNDEWGFVSGDLNSVNPGSNGYGTAVRKSQSENMTVSLTAGTYRVIANDIHPTYDDKPIRVAFVKL